ncbi:MAG: hypothetical protein LBG45_03185 [Dysgonamonadaceae bacterium]|jgi:hypothetical protein|nr:hypothetical protein [Dysgonamonadaceae bacterium]
MENKNIRYLYGASIQGIQDFIFQTNKLKEIVGASELVEQICSNTFDQFAKSGESVVRAAGNIKHIFDSREDCEQAVMRFPKEVMTMAPGITISQAVVTINADLSDYADKADELEKRLRIQRNKPVRSVTLGLTAIYRSPSTGLPAVKIKDNETIDEASEKKIQQHQATRKLVEKSFGKKLSHDEIAYDIEDITGKNDWIAVIHADGNGMGAIFREIGKDKDKMKVFSKQVSQITETAAQKAFQTVEEIYKLEKDKGKIPVRPVVLGGDDLTLVCRADMAIDYTQTFLDAFEKESKEQLKTLDTGNSKLANRLTACAGIAFVKSSYPFHYAVELAEKLCQRAKKAAKKIDADLPPSCLMFHKVQDSFVEDFDEIVKRELTPQPNLTFECGPYYCGKHAKNKNCTNTIKELLDNIEQLKGKEGNAIKSHIRQWLSLLFDNVDAANQKMKRLRTVNEKACEIIDAKYETLNLSVEGAIPYYDILSLASIMYVKTKSKEEKK